MGLINWARSTSPWVLHFNSGSCNGCDIEIVASRAPKFDLERFGILVKGSPRHADIMAVTGPVTRQAKSRLLRIYEQMPMPKYVMAIGSCAISGAPFNGSYSIHEGVDRVIPVDVYVGGCPPRPEAIIQGMLRLTEKIRGME
ncbi:NADH-quinone oxidoreductase subunit B family protein [Candidatus Bathyarchaeota archaeon]|nr:NADH-quinone oxidoreductase subunit B family protein [Candidatus Bathyarchaeota archaeon]